MFIVGQDNRLPAYCQICDPIHKALESLYTYILIAASSLTIGELSLFGSPLPEIFKLPMYEGLFVIIPVQDKGSRLSLSEITQLLKGTNPVLIRISARLMENLVFFRINSL